MKSPFPGMDPYIEECGLFEDFHNKLIGDIERTLSQSVPAHYVVLTAERPYVVLAETEGKEESAFLPDVSVVSSGSRQTPAADPGGVLVETEVDTESISMRPFIATEYRENFIEIYITEPERMLVTCIEVLSPSNKRKNSAGWSIYLRKRQGLLLGEANLVEIDLLRGGSRFPMVDPWPNSPYTLLVSRRERGSRCRVWPAHFRRALPTIPVPLVSPDPDVQLDLHPLIEAVYARSRYHNDVNYSRPLTPPLNTEEASWLAEQLRQRPTS